MLLARSEALMLCDPVEALFARTAGGILPGLGTTRRVLAALGDPHFSFPGVHVAGTNGKGSVCSMVERVLAAHGLVTGVYTSPHLVDLGERFRILGEPLGEAEVLALVAEVTEADGVSRGEDRLATFFECTTAMAFEVFRRRGVQAAVVETGLGGRWDATNVFCPQVSVITSVGLDHQGFLGDRLEEIAGEKAGIIKGGVPVVIAAQEEGVLEVLLEAAAAVRAPVVRVEEGASLQLLRSDLDGLCVSLETASASYGRLEVPLCGRYQAEHVALAVLAAECWMGSFGGELDPLKVKGAFGSLRWPGRLEVVLRDPPFVVDGAHNEPAARGLAAELSHLMPSMPGFWVLGMMEDKAVDEVLGQLRPEISEVAFVVVDEVRGCPVSRLLGCAEAEGLDVRVMGLDDACAWAWRRASEEGGYACLAGSLHLAGDFYGSRFAAEHGVEAVWVA